MSTAIKLFVNYTVLLLVTNIVMLFSVAFDLGAFNVATRDEMLYLSALWAAVSLAVFSAFMGILWLSPIKNPGLVVNTIAALVASVVSLWLTSGLIWEGSFLSPIFWSGLVYCTIITAVTWLLIRAAAPNSTNKVIWPQF